MHTPRPGTGYATRQGGRALKALRLLSGILLLATLVLASSHSHQGETTDTTRCALCQVVGLHLDARGEVPTVPQASVLLQDPGPPPLRWERISTPRPHPDPRAPPIFP
jgi:hypothetical protein